MNNSERNFQTDDLLGIHRVCQWSRPNILNDLSAGWFRFDVIFPPRLTAIWWRWIRRFFRIIQMASHHNSFRRINIIRIMISHEKWFNAADCPKWTKSKYQNTFQFFILNLRQEFGFCSMAKIPFLGANCNNLIKSSTNLKYSSRRIIATRKKEQNLWNEREEKKNNKQKWPNSFRFKRNRGYIEERTESAFKAKQTKCCSSVLFLSFFFAVCVGYGTNAHRKKEKERISKTPKTLYTGFEWHRSTVCWWIIWHLVNIIACLSA